MTPSQLQTLTDLRQLQAKVMHGTRELIDSLHREGALTDTDVAIWFRLLKVEKLAHATRNKIDETLDLATGRVAIEELVRA